MRKTALTKQVRKQFPNLTEAATGELIQQVEALLGKLNLRWQLVEAVLFSKAHNSITFLTKEEEIEVKLNEQNSSPSRRLRQYIESRASKVYQPHGTPSGGAWVRPLHVH